MGQWDDKEQGEVRQAAEKALLVRIIELMEDTGKPTHRHLHSAAVLELAEAYAWVAMPGQPHGR